MKPSKPTFDKSWSDACVVLPTTRQEVGSMIRRHYIGKWPGVCVLILAMRHHDRPVGVVVFALPPRETAKRYGGVTWELARLWIDDSVPNNAETWLISKAVRYITKHHRKVIALVSYADPSVGHQGTIYKAANWEFDGRTDEERKTPRFDYADAATGKRFSRRSHVPFGVEIRRIPRISKARFVYRIKAKPHYIDEIVKRDKQIELEYEE